MFYFALIFFSEVPNRKNKRMKRKKGTRKILLSNWILVQELQLLQVGKLEKNVIRSLVIVLYLASPRQNVMAYFGVQFASTY